MPLKKQGQDGSTISTLVLEIPMTAISIYYSCSCYMGNNFLIKKTEKLLSRVLQESITVNIIVKGLMSVYSTKVNRLLWTI